VSRQADRQPRATVDRDVRPAAFNMPKKQRSRRSPAIADYLLDVATPQSLSSLSLSPGQRVIGRAGRRATILVPADGLKLEGENVRLENLDFVAQSANNRSNDAALLRYSGSRAAFRGCRFFSAHSTPLHPIVVLWHDGKTDPATIALPSGRLEFVNCVFHCVGAAIDCRRPGAIALDLKNCLALETADLLHVDHTPKLDEAISLTLSQVTLRETGSLLSCRRESIDAPAGEITVEADNCVFAPRSGQPLLAFEGAEPPDAVLRNVRWNGTASLLADHAAAIAWKPSGGRWEPLDDSTLAIAGLVRSPLEFAKKPAPADDPARSARLLHWQAPLPTVDPPGADLHSLPSAAD
jgi:hypothetical protein